VKPTAFDVNTSSLDPGILLLEASAGTGKTWSLTSIAVRLLLEGRVKSVDRLLLVTFTRAATDELRQRLRKRLHDCERVLRGEQIEMDPFLDAVAERWQNSPDALKTVVRARRDVDMARVSTIHSFCLDILADGAFEAGLPMGGASYLEGTDLLQTAWRDSIRDVVLQDLPFVSPMIRNLKIDAGPGNHFKTMKSAARHTVDSWTPSPQPVSDLARDLAEHVQGMDFSLFGAFIDGGPDKDWKSAYKNETLRAAELLRDGADISQLTHQLALLGLTATSLEKALNKGGLKRFEDGELRDMLIAFEALVDPFKLALEQSLYLATHERYAELKQRHAMIDHDDVIAQTRARLADPRTGAALARRVGSQFQAALVDEFQDTDADQWEIFRSIFAVLAPEVPRHLLLLVGDPKQAIYRFRGADIFAYLAARGVADRCETLTHNWRSTPALVDAVNSVFGHRPKQSFALEQIEFEPVQAGRSDDGSAEAVLDLVWVDAGAKATQGDIEARVLDQLATDIVARRHELDALPKHGPRPRLAVLVRKHSQARDVMRRLRRVGIDVVLARGGDIHDSDAMGEWRVLLRSLLDPPNLKLQRRARATRLWGKTFSGLGEDATALEEIELLSSLRRSWESTGVASMAAELLGQRRTVERWLGEADGERMVTDMRHGLELLNNAESEHSLGPEALLRWAEAESRSEDPDNDERQLRLDRQSDAVLVLTNFTSKGLEFDSVYLPWAWAGREPAKNVPHSVHDPATGASILDFAGADDLKPQAVLEDVASELRIHYVELTRAIQRCVVYLAPSKKNFPFSAAAFLMAREDSGEPGPRGPWVQGELARLKAASWREEIAGRFSGPIRFRDANATDTSTTNWPRPKIQAPVALDYPANRRSALFGWRQLSYTALVRSLHDQLDLDQVQQDLPLADRADPAAAPATRSAQGIFGFARGARAGICLHELLEHADFTRAVNDDDRTRVESLLDRHALRTASAHPGDIEPVQTGLDLIERIRGEQLPFAQRHFRDLDADARLDEWEFRLPVRKLVPRAIAELVGQHWNDEEWIRIATQRLARLPERRIEGMLGGFIDLLFVEDGRWTVLDWKSNDLGPDPSRYDPANMHRAMIEHDYLVQLLFYTLAVHRFLRSRLVDYDYDRHMAGTSYVFLRGLCQDPSRGWCNQRPPRALIDALDTLFKGGRS